MSAIQQKTPHSPFFLIAMVSVVLSAIVHAYLTYNHFNLFLGHDTGPSLCQINSKFDCDAVAASSYSSFLGIPIALWGFITHLVLFIKALIYKLSWNDEPNSSGNLTLLLAGFIAFMSIVMSAISFTQLSVYCPFCLITYAFSFITLFGFVKSIPLFGIKELTTDFFSEKKSSILTLLAIPFLSWIANGIGHQQYKTSSKEQNKTINYQYISWTSSSTHDFSNVTGLEYGADAANAKMTIIEFADFRCSHCKSAAPKLHAFVESHKKDVRLVFLAYPLDGACNESIQRKNGLSCKLAKASFCSKNTKPWAVHDYIFERQIDFQSLSAIDQQLEDMAQALELDWPALSQCINSEETHSHIVATAQKGDQVGVRGTPAIFVNGRFLAGGQNIALLKKIYDNL